MDRGTPLTLPRKLGYGLGHALNDLCASMWFTYLLLFFHKVLNFDNNYSGIILLVGQLADGASTTIVGALCDKRNQPWLCLKYGQRKSWHLVGTFCVLLSFPFIFLPCLGCSTSQQGAQLMYYSAFAVVFQFGWACTQISHLALIPVLTSCQNERTGLTAIRYGMTVASNIAVYVVAWFFLGQCSEVELSVLDKDKFRNIMLVVIGLGSLTSLFFHLSVKEQTDLNPLPGSGYEEINGDSQRAVLVQPMSVKDWFKEPQFYQVAGVYMCTRLFVNLSQAYLPLYIQESLQMESKYVAIIPLVMYCSGFVTSFLMKRLNRKAGRKVTYLLGSLVGMASAAWVFFGGDREGEADVFFKTYGIFFAAALYGLAGSTVLITSLSLTAELISANTDSAAFVYGAMSFTDKVSNGLAVMVIQHYIPCLKCCVTCKWYFRDVLFYATGGAALLGLLFLFTLAPSKVGERRRDRMALGVQGTETEALLGRQDRGVAYS